MMAAPAEELQGSSYVALRTPTKGQPLGTYSRNIKESQRVKGLRSKLSPKEHQTGASKVVFPLA